MRLYISICCSLLVFPLAAETPEMIRNQYDERIELNRQYKEDYTEPVKNHPLSEKLVPLAQRNGDDWILLLTHLRDHGGRPEQFLMLRVELFAEIIPYMIEWEQAEDESEKKRLSARLKRFEERLRELEAKEEALLVKTVQKKDAPSGLALPRNLLREREAIYRGYAGGWDWVEKYEQAKQLRERVVQDNQDWVALTRAIRASGDDKLMYLFLRTELQGELYPILVDLPDLESHDRMFAAREVQAIEKQLERLTRWWEDRGPSDEKNGKNAPADRKTEP